MLETAKGTLLATSFTSLAYEPSLLAAEKKKPGDKEAWPAERLQKWQPPGTGLPPNNAEPNSANR